ncbi:hypothetical protein ACFFIF_02610 [Vagococcus entomophilus]|uniref:Uncharacterized protein n=1 Tax=Vagococcus entomophilus TaxID=1160095 RepID=A0A430AJX9_9ENTE|nr:hypothetical protein [Vagococcus entomophilus]RSU08313.1 hypothetical protein CBF30_03470 [Vagococcus entomophilus]
MNKYQKRKRKAIINEDFQTILKNAILPNNKFPHHQRRVGRINLENDIKEFKNLAPIERARFFMHIIYKKAFIKYELVR